MKHLILILASAFPVPTPEQAPYALVCSEIGKALLRSTVMTEAMKDDIFNATIMGTPMDVELKEPKPIPVPQTPDEAEQLHLEWKILCSSFKA